MSKYLCQDCINNNNGWCTVRKCNGLKKMNITSCNTFEDRNSTIVKVKQPSYPKSPRVEKEAIEKVNTQGYRTLGQREMLWKIQMQIIGINEDNILSEKDKYTELVRVIKELGKHLEFEERLWEMDKIIDSELDEDMVNYSRNINNLL